MRMTKTIRALVLGLMIWLTMSVGLPMAGAQQAEDSEPTQITVSEEPGVCSSQGSFCERLLEWTGNELFAETVAWILGTPVKIAALMLGAVWLNRLARRSIRRVSVRVSDIALPGTLVSKRSADRSTQRANAVAAILRSTASALIFSIAGVAILDTLGVSVVPIIASLGIVGIAVGFGAQSLIEDLISGVALVVEDQLGVGDRVDVGVVEGDVERLTLRSTVILARNGVRWYIPNSEIRRVANESQHKARASVQIGVAYDADLRFVALTFHQAVLDMAEEERWQEAGIDDVREPFVASLGEHAAIMELRLFIEATERRSFERSLRERLVDVASKASIELPNTQVDVWVRTKTS
jgi:small-conductance mechanosensitive channel